MYDIIEDIIAHVFQTGTGWNTTEQQTYMLISGAVILILTVTFIDLFYRLIRGIFRKGDF